MDQDLMPSPSRYNLRMTPSPNRYSRRRDDGGDDDEGEARRDSLSDATFVIPPKYAPIERLKRWRDMQVESGYNRVVIDCVNKKQST